MARSSPFSNTAAARVQRSSFDLTHVVKTAFYPGQLIPLPPIECVPGDIMHLRFNGVVRLQPLVTPVFENMKLRFYSFFVPYRILWDQWEEFITKGEAGTSVIPIPQFNPVDAAEPVECTAVNSLWDFFGFQVGNYSVGLNAGSRPIDFPWRAYWDIWNEFFRVPTIQPAENWSNFDSEPELAQPAFRNWQRDYFTSALPEAQLGLPPALPVFGSTNAVFDFPGIAGTFPTNYAAPAVSIDATNDPGFVYPTAQTGTPTAPPTWLATSDQSGGSGAIAKANLDQTMTDNNVVDGAALSGADINDLRLAWQIQVWQERNARAGSRYVEQLISHFRVAPRDERLQRPEYIGGSVTDVLISDIPQTSSSNAQPTVQGNLAGAGVAIPRGRIGSYRVVEHGLIMNLVCVTPQATYQQGIPRNWTRRTTFDFFFPEFAHLGEQAIKNSELFIANTATDDATFGYTGIFNELRYLPNRVTGQMRSDVTASYDNWHMARDFATTPPLNTELTSMADSLADLMRPFAVTSQPPLLGVLSIGLDAIRPLPFIAEPSSIGG